METNKRSQKKSKFKIELPHHFKENETFIIDQIGISNKFKYISLTGWTKIG